MNEVDIQKNQIEEGLRDEINIDPHIFDLFNAITLVEKYGDAVEYTTQ